MQTLKKHYEAFLVTLLLIVSAVPRFVGLGFPHFYGDETKTLYLDKTIPALTYFLDQRKGPMQFFVTWVVEKLSGGFNELWIRLPLAIAGLLSVLVFYFLVKKLFGFKVAYVATILYSFSGFSIAFSRTAQYQSFLILFGLLGLLLFVLSSDKSSKWLMFSSALSYVLALYCHYDAVFYLVPVLFFVTKDKIKEFLLLFVLPIVVLVSAFYVPYVIKGYFISNTAGYLSRRLVGDSETLPNNSLYTFNVYNPNVIFIALLVIGAVLALIKFKKDRAFLVVWFAVPFILFGLVFKSPGTHILQYFMPVYVLSALGWVSIVSNTDRKYKHYLISIIAGAIVLQVTASMYIFVPGFNANYPWTSSKILGYPFHQAQKNYQLFLYGFPYNRGWVQAAEYLNSQKGARGFYTNDNTVVAKYYVKKLDVTEPATNFYPQYFVDVKNNQELRTVTQDFLANYEMVKEINKDITVYKRLVTVQ